MNQERKLTEQNQNAEETEIDLLEIFYILRAKLGWLILAFAIGGMIAGSITYFLITPKKKLRIIVQTFEPFMKIMQTKTAATAA